MKKVVLYSILFLFGLESILPNSSGFSESLRLGELCKHYQLHQKVEEIPLSLTDFIWMHYAAESTHRKDNSHSKLPDIQSVTSHFCLIVFRYIITLPLQAVLVFLTTAVYGLQGFPYFFAFSADFFTPPRV